MNQNVKNALVVGSIGVVLILGWYMLTMEPEVGQIDNPRLENVSCNSGNQSTIAEWKMFTGESGYTVEFPNFELSKPAEIDMNIPTEIDGFVGAEDKLVLVSDTINNNFDTYSVTYTFLDGQPSLNEIKEYYGAEKVCEEVQGEDGILSYVDFMEAGETWYSRQHVILVGNDIYALRMNSDSPSFDGYDYFVNSFELPF